MLNWVYNWQRFWCPRSGNIHLADGGYLYDPEAKWGNVYNPDLVTFSAISLIPCLILLGEPGIGKSQAIEMEQKKVADELKNTSDQILSLNLRSIPDTYKLDSKLFKSKKFTDWLDGEHRLHIFLDSLDECLLQINKIATLLVDEFRDYQDQIHRLTFRLACRTAVFPAVLEQGMKEIFGEKSIGIYELAPLRRKDVIEAVKAEGIEPDTFLEEVHRKSIVPLAIKPITLKFLLNTYRRHNGQFPENQRLHQLYLEGCRCLCEETNDSRLASNTKGALDVDQRLIIAARIASVTVFANRFAIWTAIDRGDVPDEDVLLRKLCIGYEVVNSKEFEISESVVKEVLDTGLFSSRGEQRIGWAHQTYAEFLAAWYLVQHKTPIHLILNFSCVPEDPNKKLVPQLHETAAWLASMRSDVLEEIIKTDPDILLRSDIPTDVSLRETIVSNLLTQCEQEIFYDKEMSTYHLYWKLKHPKLAEQLRPYIADCSRQIEVRNTAINIAEVCKMILKGDIFWMLERLENSISLEARGIWLQIIQWNFDCNDTQEIDAIIAAIQTNEFLRAEFKPYFEAIEIHSEKAAQLKAEYCRLYEQQNRINVPPPLDPPPKQRVLQLLELLESGDLSAWWRLNREITLKPDSRHYGNEFEPNITKLPGWQEADKPTRDRIVNGAKEYIRRQDKIETEWIGKNKFNRSALAGCRAFLLLFLEAPNFLETILLETWRRWASVIIAFPCGNQHEDNYLDLVKLTYSKACSEVVETLLFLIDKDNEQHDHIIITSRFKKCWDKYLKSVLFDKAKDKSLKPKCMGQLLEELLEHKLDEAREYLQTLVFFPLPLDEEERERVMIASKVLFDHSTPSSWSVVWSVIQQDSDFGRELIEAVASRSYSSGTRSKLNEKQLADLYIWLVRQYPHNEDPDYSNEVMAHAVGTRESVANLRNRTLEQLKNFGTLHACNEIQRIAQEFPELTWLKKMLIDAQNIMRRKTWEPPSSDEILHMISSVRTQTIKKILFLASNPADGARLRLDQEMREIDEALHRANQGDQFRCEQKWAIRDHDLRRALLDIKPQIVHFSGHGAEDGIVVEDNNGKSKLISTEALASLFELCADHVECVILNACYSEIQANAIVHHINYVIGMSQAIGDTAAIKFVTGFYDALGAGKDIEMAYKFGCNAIQLENIPEHLTPQIKKKPQI